MSKNNVDHPCAETYASGRRKFMAYVGELMGDSALRTVVDELRRPRDPRAQRYVGL